MWVHITQVYVACCDNVELWNNICHYVFEVAIRAIGVDNVHGFVYWADNRKNIKQATQDGSNVKVIISDTGKLNVISFMFSNLFVTSFATICTIDFIVI